VNYRLDPDFTSFSTNIFSLLQNSSQDTVSCSDLYFHVSGTQDSDW
jgi:hypothetical protein